MTNGLDVEPDWNRRIVDVDSDTIGPTRAFIRNDNGDARFLLGIQDTVVVSCEIVEAELNIEIWGRPA